MSKSNTKFGVTFADLLLVAFIVMKLAGVIDWSWWWVFSPLWVPLGLLLILLSLAGFVKWAQRGTL